MDTNDQLIIQNILLNSKMTYSTVEQVGILSEVERIKSEQPERSITEITNAQLDKIKEVRGLKDDTRSRIRGEIAQLSQKATKLSEDCTGNEDELRATLKQIDKLQGQL